MCPNYTQFVESTCFLLQSTLCSPACLFQLDKCGIMVNVSSKSRGDQVAHPLFYLETHWMTLDQPNLPCRVVGRIIFYHKIERGEQFVAILSSLGKKCWDRRQPAESLLKGFWEGRALSDIFQLYSRMLGGHGCDFGECNDSQSRRAQPGWGSGMGTRSLLGLFVFLVVIHCRSKQQGKLLQRVPRSIIGWSHDA